ncbi:hypothetical protein M1466_02310 [Candidatus Dependentiae bacterium]|nr:hypothetical protein [Candidatus Dependentiae bacterium]
MKIPLVQAFIHPEIIATDAVWFVASPIAVPGVLQQLAARIAAQYQLRIRNISLAEYSGMQDQRNQHSLLSTTTLYTITDISLPLNRAQLSMIQQLQQTIGNNRALIAGTGTKQLPELPTIIIPAQLGKAEALQIVQSLYNNQAEQHRVISCLQQVFAHQQSLPTVTVFALLPYAQLLGGRVQEFIEQRLSALMPVQESLFDVSAALLARDARKFTQLYTAMLDSYPSHFWVTWWSEQLFKAHGYIVAKQQKNAAASAAISSRLPFSFLERDYRLVKQEQIRIALQELYWVDYWLKNGCGDERLTWWYCRWFGAKKVRVHR